MSKVVALEMKNNCMHVIVGYDLLINKLIAKFRAKNVL